MKNLLKKLKIFFNVKIEIFIKDTLTGWFWLIPIGILATGLIWVYSKADLIASLLFHMIGINADHYPALWILVAVIIFVVAGFVVGRIIQTKIGNWFKQIIEIILTKIPGYKFIRDLVGLFNSAKKGNNSLVVMIKGFSDTSYNTGLMYAIKGQ